jgi:hypothetical protein
MSDGALVEAISIVAQARTAAILEARRADDGSVDESARIVPPTIAGLAAWRLPLSAWLLATSRDHAREGRSYFSPRRMRPLSIFTG